MQHWKNRDGEWELAVPNGRYRLKLVAGDANDTGGHTAIDVEDNIVLAGNRSSWNPWLFRNVDVSVNDGRLSIDNSQVASNNRLSFVQVQRLDGSFGPGNGGNGGSNNGGGNDNGGNNGGGGTINLLPGATITNGNLKVTGDSWRNNIVRLTDVGNDVYLTVNGQNKKLRQSDIKSVDITGGPKNDHISTAGNLDLAIKVSTGGGDDYLAGGERNDTLNGGAGNDKIFGNGGDDLLNGDAGYDLGEGGAGYDRGTGLEAGSVETGGPGGGNTGGNGGDGGGDNSGGDNGGNDGNNGGGDNGGGDGAFSDNSAVKPTARIHVYDGTINAGNAVFVHGTNSTLRTGGPTDARYEWDFGDPAGKYNKMVGFNASHVYDRPGNYTVTLRVLNAKGGEHTTRTTVTVANANRRAFYVAPWGYDGNDGSQARPLRSMEGVENRMRSMSNVAVYFHRGHTYDTNQTFDINGDNVVIDAYGGGAAPTLRLAKKIRPAVLIRVNASAENTVVQNVKLDSPFGRPDGGKDDLPIGIQPLGRYLVARNITVGTIRDFVAAEAARRSRAWRWRR